MNQNGLATNFTTISIETMADGITVCRFNRPDKRNALNQLMVDELREFIHLPSTENIRALIFTGPGKAFIGGADIGELKDRRREDALKQINSRLFHEIQTFHAPTIAAINGYALGGGNEFALACDIRLASEHAKLGQPEVGLGIIPAAGATYRLPTLVGAGWARELIFSGKMIDSQTALRIGLVNRVLAHENLMDEALALAKEISAKSPLAVRLAKQALNFQAGLQAEALRGFESSLQAILFEDEEKFHRMDAFFSQRLSNHKESHNDPA